MLCDSLQSATAATHLCLKHAIDSQTRMQLIIYHGLKQKKKKNPSTTQSFRQGMHLMIPLLLLLWKAELCLAGLSDITHVKQRAAKNKKECPLLKDSRRASQKKVRALWFEHGAAANEATTLGPFACDKDKLTLLEFKDISSKFVLCLCS